MKLIKAFALLLFPYFLQAQSEYVVRDTFQGVVMVTDSIVVLKRSNAPYTFNYVDAQIGVMLCGWMVKEYGALVRASDGRAITEQESSYFFLHDWTPIDNRRVVLFRITQ